MAGRYKVRFYVGNVGPNRSVYDLLSQLSQRQHPLIYDEEETLYLVKDIQDTGRGSVYRGIFGKIRTSDIPKIINPEGIEREIDLHEHEGLIDKNYFLFFHDHQLLVFQENFHASKASAFARYLSHVAGNAVSYDPVLNIDAMRRFMRGQTNVVRAKITIARPTNPRLFPRNRFSRELLRMMAATGSATLHVTCTANRPGQRMNVLVNTLKADIRDLVRGDHATNAKAWIDDGSGEPIDLIEDRLGATINVQMVDRYPVPESIFAALNNAHREVSAELTQYFGVVHEDN